MDQLAPNPADIPAPGSYRWTPKLQRDFLEQLAITGSVKIASAMVCMSTSAAYQLKQRPEGAAFGLGWAAAVLIARGRLADELLDRAIWGIEEITDHDNRTENGAQTVRRKRHSPSLGLAMLARLDRAVETRAKAGEAMLAQIIAGDWAGFLSLFDVAADNPDAAGHGAALACWLAGRDNRANPLATLWKNTPIAREVAQFSVPAEPERKPAPTPEEDVATMTMWSDRETGEWLTDFPPPENYVGNEEGQFGDVNYKRTLDAEEDDARLAANEAWVAPRRTAGEAARRRFFGLPMAANDEEGRGKRGSREDAKPRR